MSRTLRSINYVYDYFGVDHFYGILIHQELSTQQKLLKRLFFYKWMALASQERTNERCDHYKEELIMKTCHPRRMLQID
jgi:hypothetical protein